jgi:hypothetical protein
MEELLTLNNVLLALGQSRFPGHPGGNEAEERELSLFFEACIWLLHFGGSGGITSRATDEVPSLSSYGPYGVQTGPATHRELRPDKAIVQYWIARLPHPKGKGGISFVQYEKGKRISYPPQMKNEPRANC